jgi:hypothetical protein
MTMNNALRILAVTGGLAALGGGALWAQQPRVIYGMFGPRVQGVPLTPGGSSAFGQSGLVRGPSGDFVGRSAYAPTMAFPGQPWQYPWATYQSYPAFLGPMPVEVLNGGMATQPPAPLPPQPEAQPQPEAPPQPAPTQPPAGPVQPMREIGPPQTSTAPAAGEPSPVTILVGFHPAEPGSAPAQAVAKLIQHLSEIKKLTPVTVTMQGDTAILRGRVASDHDRALAESIALLEPGIWNVRNELWVAGKGVRR